MCMVTIYIYVSINISMVIINVLTIFKYFIIYELNKVGVVSL